MGNIVDNEQENINEEQGGNTESRSNQYSFSKTDKSSSLEYKSQSELDKKPEKKDVKKISFNPIFEKREQRQEMRGKKEDRYKIDIRQKIEDIRQKIEDIRQKSEEES